MRRRAAMHRPGSPAPGTGESVPGPPEGNGSSPVLVLAGAQRRFGGAVGPGAGRDTRESLATQSFRRIGPPTSLDLPPGMRAPPSKPCPLERGDFDPWPLEGTGPVPRPGRRQPSQSFGIAKTPRQAVPGGAAAPGAPEPPRRPTTLNFFQEAKRHRSGRAGGKVSAETAGFRISWNKPGRGRFVYGRRLQVSTPRAGAWGAFGAGAEARRPWSSGIFVRHDPPRAFAGPQPRPRGRPLAPQEGEFSCTVEETL